MTMVELDGKWEYIGHSASRLWIPSGWLVTINCQHIIEISDITHSWKLEE